LSSLKNKPIAETDNLSWAWCGVIFLYLYSLLTIMAIFVPMKNANFIALRLLVRISGLVAIPVAIAKTKEIQYIGKYVGYREVIREDQTLTGMLQQNAAPSAPQRTEPQPEDNDGAIALYDYNRLEDESTGFLVSGAPGYGKTSFTLWLLGWLTRTKPAHIRVCDPHSGINRAWEDNGLSPASEYEDIEAEFEKALEEFKARKLRAKNREPIGELYILVCDETDNYERNFKNKDLFHEVQVVFGKECRKYNMISIFITHTSNVTNKRIDAQERDCFTLVNLGTSAVAVAEKYWGKKSLEYQILAAQAYPCLIRSGGCPVVAIHPTHGEYSEYQKEGLPPKNILPINKIESYSVATPLEGQNSATPEEDYLKRVWDMEFDLSSYSVATPLEGQNSATNHGDQCPYCRSYNLKWLQKRTRRKQCKDCHGSFTLK
jgi:hypothetical protein